MNKKLTTADRFPIGVGSYVSPRTTVTEVVNEGVLCSSFQQYEEETLEW